MESLEADSLGYMMKSGPTVAFPKGIPRKVEESSITKHGISMDVYRKSFFKVNMDVSNNFRDRIKANFEIASTILNATEDDDSNCDDGL